MQVDVGDAAGPKGRKTLRLTTRPDPLGGAPETDWCGRDTSGTDETLSCSQDSRDPFPWPVGQLYLPFARLHCGPGIHWRGNRLGSANPRGRNRLDERSPPTPDDLVAPRTGAGAVRSSVPQAGQAPCVSGFHAFVPAGIIYGGPGDHPVPVAAQALLAGSEPVFVADCSVWHDALAVCLHKSGNQTITIHILGRLPGACGRKNS